jgi:hypothetical protein
VELSVSDGYQFLNKRLHTHIDLVRSIRDRDRARLNGWEERFLTSIVRYDSPTAKQMEVLRGIVGKALAKEGPKRGGRRPRSDR